MWPRNCSIYLNYTIASETYTLWNVYTMNSVGWNGYIEQSLKKKVKRKAIHCFQRYEINCMLKNPTLMHT